MPSSTGAPEAQRPGRLLNTDNHADHALDQQQASSSESASQESPIQSEKTEKFGKDEDDDSVSLRDSDNDGDDDDDESSGSSSRERAKQKQQRDAARQHRPRSLSLLSRSLSRRRSQGQSRPQSLADVGPPVTRTVSEVRDGVYYRRDVEIDGIEREEKQEREGLGPTDSRGRAVDLEKGLGGGNKEDAGGGASSSQPGATGATAGAGAGADANADADAEERDPNLVKWDGPDDPENPKNWIFSRKWAAVFIVSLFTLISPVSSSMIAPAIPEISRELHITNSVEQLVTMSIFVLAYAVGPLFLGPLSELYGRVIVLQLSNLVYLFFNLGCGLARTRGEMIAFRFLSGFGGSAPLAIGGGVLGDLFTAEERGRALSLYSLAPLLGPAIGPVAGAFIAQNTTWRWVFYATTIADGAIQTAGLFFLRETYAPVLLSRKRDRLAKQTGNAALYTVFDKERARGVVRSLGISFSRPFILLGTQLIVQVLALYMMYLYGLMYLLLASFSSLWTEVYHERTGVAGLHYIALGIGFTLGSQVLAPLQDRIYAYLKRRYNVTVGRPEFRVPVMVPGALLVPAGLLIYGWCAEYKTHWIGPDMGGALLTMGVIVGFQCIQGYLVDTYTHFAASAVAAATVMRSLAGFGFPLFAPNLYDKLGYGKGNTLLAAIGIVIGFPAPFMLWKYGPYLRTKKAAFQG
ncbi:major facilitator superfamily transporter multidrug resistance [Niveomyces insectorum RCEF 264]|uniref:Major facilitator superfamily transporter multidrug resistance n=1 Tax=Niveomyces insectorum RCEF 264 TaxID=1081102 RepID=A0A162MMQ5_9HYPO|nr:major facilitator superfamily transporter multidrug resistance [Niveomyces insectorum RCEF 264]